MGDPARLMAFISVKVPNLLLKQQALTGRVLIGFIFEPLD